MRTFEFWKRGKKDEGKKKLNGDACFLVELILSWNLVLSWRRHMTWGLYFLFPGFPEMPYWAKYVMQYERAIWYCYFSIFRKNYWGHPRGGATNLGYWWLFWNMLISSRPLFSRLRRFKFEGNQSAPWANEIFLLYRVVFCMKEKFWQVSGKTCS